MEDTNLAAMYQATVYPIYVVIDRDGFIAGTQRGAGGEEALRRRRVSREFRLGRRFQAGLRSARKPGTKRQKTKSKSRKLRT